MTRRALPRSLRRLPFYLVVAVIVVYTLTPFVWAISTSLKGEGELFGPARLIPQNPSLTNYVNVLSSAPFMRSLGNSVLVAGGSALTALAAGSLAAYALGRLRFRGKTAMLYAVLAMTMFPQIAVLSGLYVNVRELGLYGTQAALLFSCPLFTLPFAAWVLTSFFRGLPREIEEAAAMIVTLPLVLLVLVFQQRIAAGLTAGSVKG